MPSPSHPSPAPARRRFPTWLLAIGGGILALAAVEFYAIQKYGRLRAPEPPPAPAASAPAAAAATDAAGSPVVAALAPIIPPADTPPPKGWLDTPENESIVATKIALGGWAFAKGGIARVEVRVDDRVYQARHGLHREDVARAHPEFGGEVNVGFSFEGDFSDLVPARHEITVVAVGNDGREKVIARRSLVPPAAKSQWSALLDERPALADRKFYYLMMTSGVRGGGADEIVEQYADYQSRTQRVGMSVPVLYMRTTKGAKHDWAFDPAFDVTGPKCGDRAVADDSLEDVLRYSAKHRLPVNVILNGGIWGDATCEAPEWDLTDHLEQDANNVQWDQNGQSHPDDLMKDIPGSVPGPQLGRSLTYHVYASAVRAYKKRNLQAAARRLARFGREHPDLLVGVTLDADTYMNPFLGGGYRFDYNPGMLRQFREWLQGTGPYAGKGGPGVPDLRSFRRPDPLTLAQVNALARKNWTSWDEVEPQRELVGVNSLKVPEGEVPFWLDPWYLEWDAFRKHVIHLHYVELADWVHAMGVPSDRIFTAQAFTAPDPGLRPVSIDLRGWTPDYDSAGVSIEGSVPRKGHLGTIMYGLSAQDRHGMANGRGVYSNIARHDEAWAVVESNATDLKMPKRNPDYEASYRMFRSINNYDGRQIGLMAWNGSNGMFDDDPDFLPYTAFRNTDSERAMKDAMIARADLPRGSRLWTFGAARHPTDDGWTTSRGTLSEGYGHIDVAPDGGIVEIVSPPDQVIRTNRLDLALVRSFAGPKPRSIAVHARLAEDKPWVEVGRAEGGERVTLRWPKEWAGAIASQVKLELGYAPDVVAARLDRVLLYPARDAFREAAVRKAG